MTHPGGLVVEQVLVQNLGEEAAHACPRVRADRAWRRCSSRSTERASTCRSFAPASRWRGSPRRRSRRTSTCVHVARRLHKPRGIECRLGSIEREVLGFVRENDVPGSEVSACYLHFLRTGDAGGLLGVVEHNAWDVVAMAALVGLYGEPLEGSQLDAVDLVGVARTLKRARAVDEAWEVVERAVAGGGGRVAACARGDREGEGGQGAGAGRLRSARERGGRPRVRLELAKLYEHSRAIMRKRSRLCGPGPGRGNLRGRGGRRGSWRSGGGGSGCRRVFRGWISGGGGGSAHADAQANAHARRSRPRTPCPRPAIPEPRSPRTICAINTPAATATFSDSTAPDPRIATTASHCARTRSPSPSRSLPRTSTHGRGNAKPNALLSALPSAPTT